MHEEPVRELAELISVLVHDEILEKVLARGFTELEITDMLCQLEYACEKMGY